MDEEKRIKEKLEPLKLELRLGEEIRMDDWDMAMVRAYRVGYADGQAKAHLKESPVEEV